MNETKWAAFRRKAVELGVLSQDADDAFHLTYPADDPEHAEAAKRWAAMIRRETRRSNLPNLPGFRRLGELGKGGFGVVYKAEQECTNKVVAIKVLDGEVLPARVRRFQREVELLARLDSQHIVRVITTALADDRRPVLVMDFAGEYTITSYAKNHSLSLSKRVELMIDACLAVDYAHRSNIIHRDIKPSNVLVNAEGHLRLVDFGIAKLHEPDPEDAYFEQMEDRHPHSGCYSSPEQCDPGKSTPLSLAGDIYSLGALLYELVTETLPESHCEGSGPIAVTHPALRVGQANPKHFGLSKAGELDRALRGDLGLIILKAMETNPGNRYRLAEEMATDLDNWLKCRPVKARSEQGRDMPYPVRLFVRRNPVWMALSLVLLLSLTTATIMAISRGQQAVRNAAEATAERDKAESRRQALEVEYQKTKVVAEKFRAGVEDLGRRMRLSGQSDAAVLRDMYWKLAQDAAKRNESKLVQEMLVSRALEQVDRALENDERTISMMRNLREELDRDPEVRKNRIRGGEGVLRGPSGGAFLELELRVALLELDASGTISDLDGLRNAMRKSRPLIDATDAESVNAIRVLACGDSSAQTVLRTSAPEVSQLCKK